MKKLFFLLSIAGGSCFAKEETSFTFAGRTLMESEVSEEKVGEDEFLAAGRKLIEKVNKAPEKSEGQSYTYWDVHPLHVGGNAIWIGGADLSDTPRRGKLFFRKANAFFYMIVPINRKSYFLPRVEWNAFTMDWTRNPKFNQHHFTYAKFALTFYSTQLEKWHWIVRTDYNLDTDHFSDPGRYGLFSGLLWGIHEINEKWHLHIGAYGYSGMRGEQVYPVIGFDYSPDKHWTVLLAFPIEYYVQYKIDPHWKFSLRGTPLKERFRTGANEPQPRSIFSYSSMGTELNVKYQIFLRLEAEAYAGYNWGGTFYIKNEHGSHALYTDVGGAPYVGLNLNWGI
jgi:hypothetical protein